MFLCANVLNSDWKMPLRGPVSYVGHETVCASVSQLNKTRWKRYVICVGGMPEGNVTTRIAWTSGKLYNHRRTKENRGVGKKSH